MTTFVAKNTGGPSIRRTVDIAEWTPTAGTSDPIAPIATSLASQGALRGSVSPMPCPRWSFGTGADRRRGGRGELSWIGGRSKWLPRVLDLVQRRSPVGRISGLADAPQVDRAGKAKGVGRVHGEEPEAKADGHRSSPVGRSAAAATVAEVGRPAARETVAERRTAVVAAAPRGRGRFRIGRPGVRCFADDLALDHAGL